MRHICVVLIMLCLYVSACNTQACKHTSLQTNREGRGGERQRQRNTYSRISLLFGTKYTRTQTQTHKHADTQPLSHTHSTNAHAHARTHTHLYTRSFLSLKQWLVGQYPRGKPHASNAVSARSSPAARLTSIANPTVITTITTDGAPMPPCMSAAFLIRKPRLMKRLRYL